MNTETRKSIERTVIRLVNEHTEKEVHLSDDLQEDLGMDSLDMANLCWLLNVVYDGVTFDIPMFDGCKTVEDVVHQVANVLKKSD